MQNSIEIQPATLTLNNQVTMPQIGLGVLKAQANGEVEAAVLSALQSGYRKIDTAAAYRNESGVGRAILQSQIPREEIFLTTKVWNTDQGYDKTLSAFEQSLERLQTDYVDLYLVHWPVAGKYKDTYRALEKIYREGRAKAIGVSNFQIHHLEDLLAHSQIVPAVNQIELHPHLQQDELIAFAQQNRIQIEAWRPIMMGQVLSIPELVQIGEKHGKSAVQITLRWLLQRKVSIIPKSVHPQRIADNFDVFDFELSREEMKSISALNENRRLGPDPDNFNF
ncbi:MAG: aldo/keto reductase [Saprospiraceae bacterium]|nr:aldo/keto reductase [Saprospiraceae bacterium]